MPIPDYQTLMLPVLNRAAQGETRVPEVEENIAAEFNLTPGERNQMLPSRMARSARLPRIPLGISLSGLLLDSAMGGSWVKDASK